jgi:hypothetical protein
MAVRAYNGTSDRTVLTGGGLGAAINADFTLIAVVKPQSTGGPNPIIALESTTSCMAALCFAGSNLQLYSDTDDTFAFVGLTTTSYWILAVTHASGTNKPRFHAMPFGGSWTHIDGAATIVNKTASVSVVRLGSMNLFNGAVIDYGAFNGATAGFVPSALSDLAIEAVGTALTTQSIATAGATGLFDLNQASTATAVTDLEGTSTQSSQVGTTVVTGDDPPGWVFGLSGGGATATPIAFPRNPLAEMYAQDGAQRARLIALVRQQRFPSFAATTYTITPSGLLTPTGALAKSTQKALTGGITPSGAPAKLVSKALSGAITPTGTLAKVASKALSGGVTPTGALVKLVAKALAGAVTPTGALVKLVAKALAGAVTPTGALGLVRVILRTFSGAVTPSGALAKLAGKSLGGTTTPSGTVAKQGKKALAGSTTPAGALAKLVSKPLSGAVTPAGALALTRVILRSFAGAITPSGSVKRQTSKQLAATATPSGSLQRSTSKHVAGSITPTGALAKRITRTLIGAIHPAGALASQVGAAIWTLLRLRSWDHRAITTRLRDHRAVSTEMHDHQADDINPSEH